MSLSAERPRLLRDPFSGRTMQGMIKHQRVLAATLAALAFAATPAFAGENDDDGDDQAAAQSAPAPAPAGGVGTGLGGTAPGDSSGLLAALAAGGLLTGAGGLVALRRRLS